MPNSASNSVPNNLVVRWYVMTIPVTHSDPNTYLTNVNLSFLRHGQPELEFFAPKIIDVQRSSSPGCRAVEHSIQSYVFIHASEKYIWELKPNWLSSFSFLPKHRDDSGAQFPYITDADIEQLRLLEKLNDGVLHNVVMKKEELAKGDIILITEGKWKGHTAVLLSNNGVKHKDIVVNFGHGFNILLDTIADGQFQIVKFSNKGKHLYHSFGNESKMKALRKGVMNAHQNSVTQDDIKTATEALAECESLELDSTVMRCKQFAVQLYANIILAKVEQRTTISQDEVSRLIGVMNNMFPILKNADQARAQLALALYAATGVDLFYDRAMEAILPWKHSQKKLTKAKQNLINQANENHAFWTKQRN